MKKIKLQISILIQNLRVYRAKSKAEKLSKLTRYNYLVINWENKPVCISRKLLKQLIAKKVFQKHLTIEMIEKMAFYKTY